MLLFRHLIRFGVLCLLLAGGLYAQPALGEIEQMIERKEYSRASRLLQELENCNPGHPENFYWQGLILYHQEYLHAAQVSFEMGIKANPRFAYNHAGLGMVLFKQEKADQAHKRLAKALNVGRRDIRINFAVAKAYREEGSNESLKQAEVLIVQATNWLGYRRTCEVINYRNDKTVIEPSQQLDLCYHALETGSSCVAAYVCIAKGHIEQNRFTDAFRMLKKAQKLDANYSPIYQQLGELSIKQGDFQQAKQHYGAYLELNESDFYGSMRYASCLFMLEDYLNTLEAINDLDSISALGLRLKGLSHLELGNTDSALVCIQTYFARQEERYRIPYDYLAMAMVLYASGNHLAATPYLQQAIELDSTMFFQLKTMADQAKARENYDQESMLRKLYLEHLETPSIRDYYFLGIAQFRSHQFNEADSNFSACIVIKSDFTAAHFWRLRIAKKLDPDHTQWLAVPHAEQIISYIGDKPIGDLKIFEKRQLKTCYHLMTRYHFDEQSDGTGNCEAARPWFEKALFLDPEQEELLMIKERCND